MSRFTCRWISMAGVTLVELMVALALSLLLAAGAVTLFVSSKESYSLQQAVGRAQTDAIAAIRFLESQIQLTGYPEDSLTMPSGIDASSDDNLLRFTFLAPWDGYRDCVGDSYTDGDEVVMEIRSDGDTLVCENADNDEVELIQGVSNLTFAYGEDTNATLDGAPNGYVTRAEVGDLRNVIAVRMSFDVQPDHEDIASSTRAFSTTVVMRNQVHK